MLLLWRGLAVEELARLAVVIGKACRAQPDLLAFLGFGKRPEAALRRFPRTFPERVRLVVHPVDRIAHRHIPSG